jgi:hypothetical protein
MNLLFKHILILTILVFSTVTSFASVCGGNFVDGDVASTPISAILCPVERILNIVVYASGIVFACFIVYSGIKLSMSWGDPKGFEAAKMSLIYAGLGFGVVLGFWVIFKLSMNIFGLDEFSNPAGIFSKFESGVGLFNNIIYK